MKREKVEFKNSRGIKLSGILSLPEKGSPKAFGIIAHCFTCNKNFINIKYISEALTNDNIGILRLDFTGLGESEGEFAKTSFTTNIDDLMDTAAFLSENYAAPELLIGHSLGGSAAIVAAGKIESVKALAVIGTPSTLNHIKRLFENKIEEITANGTAIIDVAGNNVEIGKEFVDDLSAYNLKKSLNELNKPLLIMHSPQDQLVGIDHATSIFMSARHPKSFISLDRIDHLIKDPREARYVGRLISTWSSRYISQEVTE